jgi:hypothetical protein
MVKGKATSVSFFATWLSKTTFPRIVAFLVLRKGVKVTLIEGSNDLAGEGTLASARTTKMAWKEASTAVLHNIGGSQGQR